MENYLDFSASGDFPEDIREYFLKFNRMDTYNHTLEVIEELFHIEKCYGHVEPGSITGCYCHDLGRVVRNGDILKFCSDHNIMILEEERALPEVLHPKISRFIAGGVFGIKDEVILDAIRYHSTSRRNPSMTEIEVLLADKMSWKEEGYREFAMNVKERLKVSKEHAMIYYLKDLYDNRDKLKVYHPDAKEAFDYFAEIISF